ncbi:replication/maintenance protein RepL, partial [Staphylococcus epidermidis]|uniref:replication/maintenance protein RepL n=1 Tax=Staphylococcus epidermidis TaxID=1282 RepID=UPI001643338A
MITQPYPTLYNPKQHFINKHSPHILHFHKLYTPQTAPNFLKIYIQLFPQILPLLNKKPQIIHYLFKHLNLSTNTIIKTLTQLPQQTNTTT